MAPSVGAIETPVFNSPLRIVRLLSAPRVVLVDARTHTEHLGSAEASCVNRELSHLPTCPPRDGNDKSHSPADLAYPPKPNNKGYATRFFNDRQYYFGPHNSSGSFVLFGEWRARLIETGTPPDTKELKSELKEAGLIVEQEPFNWPRVALGIAAIAMLVCVVSSTVTWYIAKNFSTSTAQFVDEEFGVITEDDRHAIRGYRQHLERQRRLLGPRQEGRDERIAARSAAHLKRVNDGKEAAREEGT